MSVNIATTPEPTGNLTAAPTGNLTAAPTGNPTPDPTQQATEYECPRANCADLLWTGPLWGDDAATGVYLGTLRISSIFIVIHIHSIFAVSVSAPYTNDQLQWIGCSPINHYDCPTSSFYCTDHSSESITFGATSGTVRSLLGPGDFPTNWIGCASSSNPRSIMNAPDKTADAMHLCHQVISRFVPAHSLSLYLSQCWN